MVDFLVTKLHDPHFMTMLFAAIAESATVYTLIMPLFAGENLNKRMKAVASERVQTIRSVVREVAGFAPYERRAMELIRNSKVCMKKGCGREAALQWRTVS